MATNITLNLDGVGGRDTFQALGKALIFSLHSFEVLHQLEQFLLQSNNCQCVLMCLFLSKPHDQKGWIITQRVPNLLYTPRAAQ